MKLRIRKMSSLLYSTFEEVKHLLEPLRLDHLKDMRDPDYKDENFRATYFLGKSAFLTVTVFLNTDIVFKFFFDEEYPLVTRSTNLANLKQFIPELDSEISRFVEDFSSEKEVEVEDKAFLKSYRIEGVTARILSKEDYLWHTYSSNKPLSLTTTNGKKTIQMEKGVKFGLRPSTSSSAIRMITEKFGPTIVFTLTMDEKRNLLHNSDCE